MVEGGRQGGPWFLGESNSGMQPRGMAVADDFFPANREGEREVHAQSSAAVPPAVTGTTWSTWNSASCPACDSPQYSQRSSARRITWRRASAGMVMRSDVPAVQPLRPQP